MVRGLRLLPVRATGYSPHVLVYKQVPLLPLPSVLRAMTVDEVAEWGPRHVEELMGIWAVVLDEVRSRLALTDERAKAQYMRRKGLDKVDVRFVFVEGD